MTTSLPTLYSFVEYNAWSRTREVVINKFANMLRRGAIWSIKIRSSRISVEQNSNWLLTCMRVRDRHRERHKEGGVCSRVLYRGVGRCVWKLPRNAVRGCFIFLSFFPRSSNQNCATWWLAGNCECHMLNSQLRLQLKTLIFPYQRGFM